MVPRRSALLEPLVELEEDDVPDDHPAERGEEALVERRQPLRPQRDPEAVARGSVDLRGANSVVSLWASRSLLLGHYRVSHLVIELGWIELDFSFLSTYPTT